MKTPQYVNINVPRDLRDSIKELAKEVPRRTMISYLQIIINAEKAKRVKK